MIRLRGHHLLCLQGFQGLGYDDRSVARLHELYGAIEADPSTPVEVVEGPDAMCEPCPHLSGETCVRKESLGACLKAHITSPERHPPSLRARLAAVRTRRLP